MKAPLHVSNYFVPAAAGVAIAIALSMLPATAQTPSPGPRELPARTIPVPDSVSPQMQKLIAAPLVPTWNVIPNAPEEWKAQVNTVTVATMQGLPALREALHVKVEPTTIDGVKAYMVTP
jgi:epsilon-lactone hydrolase